MTKLGKEKGLISYSTLNDFNANMALASNEAGALEPRRVRDTATGRLVDKIRHTTWRSIVRPRTIVYFLGWAAIGLAMVTALSLRSPLSLSVLHDRNPLYVTLKDGTIRNGYDVKVLNMTPTPRAVALWIEGLPGATMSLADSRGATSQTLGLELEADKVLPLRLYIHANGADLPPGQSKFQILVESTDGIRASTETSFETPEEPK